MDNKVLVHALAMKLRDLAYHIESDSESGRVQGERINMAKDIISESERLSNK